MPFNLSPKRDWPVARCGGGEDLTETRVQLVANSRRQRLGCFHLACKRAATMLPATRSFIPRPIFTERRPGRQGPSHRTCQQRIAHHNNLLFLPLPLLLALDVEETLKRKRQWTGPRQLPRKSFDWGVLPFYGAVTSRRERTRAGRSALATDAASPPPVNI